MFRFILAFALLLAAVPAQATEAGWALMRDGGQVVLLRHANAPGSGDPANFDIENCGTQRNLSARGRQQARRMGALFLARAAPITKVLTSRYCRARDTGELAFGASLLESFEALDELSSDEAVAEKQKAAILERIAEYSGADNLIMVTHQSIIQALVGASAREGEALILSRGGDSLTIAARITFN